MKKHEKLHGQTPTIGKDSLRDIHSQLLQFALDLPFEYENLLAQYNDFPLAMAE